MPKVPITSRVIPNRVALTSKPLARFIAQRCGCSAAAAYEALRLIRDGIKQALVEGYTVHWEGAFVVEVRELEPRSRYCLTTKTRQHYASSSRVHVRVSEAFTRDVKDRAAERLKALTESTLLSEQPASKSKK